MIFYSCTISIPVAANASRIGAVQRVQKRFHRDGHQP
jgi:hypothetical protein